jgi:uncharacterized protein (DUF3820 family)
MANRLNDDSLSHIHGAGIQSIPMFNQHGTALSQMEREALAKKKGICVRCGVRTHKVKMFKSKPLTNDDVYMGVCIRDYPSGVPSPIVHAWEIKFKTPVAAVIPVGSGQKLLSPLPIGTKPFVNQDYTDGNLADDGIQLLTGLQENSDKPIVFKQELCYLRNHGEDHAGILFADYVEKNCEPKASGDAMNYSEALNLSALSKQLKPTLKRHSKADVLPQLPSKFRSCLCLTGSKVVMQQEQKMLHELMKNDGFKVGENLEDSGAKATSLISYLVNKTNLDIDNPSNCNRTLEMLATVRKQTAVHKLKPAVKLLENVILSQKVVVFCHQRKLISRLLETFGDQAVSVVGGMDRESRSSAVRRFQQDNQVRIFIGSIHAAGTGITLTAASHVVFLELDWSPVVMSQAEDRCHCVGQTDSVQVQYYVFKDTIDEWIARSLLSKQSNLDQILPETVSTQTGYVFDFGKYKDIRLEDVPQRYIAYLVRKDLWMTRPKLWQALFQNGIVFEHPPPDGTQEDAVLEQPPPDRDVNFIFDFGKHKGLKWKDTPSTYREWIIREGVWKGRPTMQSALAAAGLVTLEISQEGLDSAEGEIDVNYIFDFGKHTGLRWKNAPPTYRDWVIREGVWSNHPTLHKALAAAGLVSQKGS